LQAGIHDWTRCRIVVPSIPKRTEAISSSLNPPILGHGVSLTGNSGLLCFREDSDQYYPAGWNLGRELFFVIPQIFLSPEVANTMFSGQTEFGPTDGDDLLALTSIAESHREAAIFHLLAQDEGVGGFADNAGTFAQRILIHLDDLRIAQDSQVKSSSFAMLPL